MIQKSLENSADVEADNELVSHAAFEGEMSEVQQETASEEESCSNDWEHNSDFELIESSASD